MTISMTTRININSNGAVAVRVTFDVTARTLRLETGMTDAGTARAIGDAIERMVQPQDRARARAEVAQLRAHNAPADTYAREIMRIVIDQCQAIGLPEDYDVDLGDWKVSDDEIPTKPRSPKPGAA